MKASKRYKPLWDIARTRDVLNDPRFESLSQEKKDYWESLDEVSVVVITGGRGSGKSLGVSLAETYWTSEHGHRVYSTRYTSSSLTDSVKADFEKAVEIMGYDEYFNIQNKGAYCPGSGGKVVFKGLKASSKNQTANVKSLSGFSILKVEEAEEIPDFDTFDKASLSLRHPEVKNFSVLMLNPTTKQHWIFKEYFEERGVPEGFNGIKDEVLYIHTTYKDVKKEFHTEENWRRFEEGRLVYERLNNYSRSQIEVWENKRELRLYKWFKHVVLGGWLDRAEGVIYTDWVIGEFDPSHTRIFGMDFGANDPTALVELSIDKKNKKIYIKQHIYTPNLDTDTLCKRTKEFAKDMWVICDSAAKLTIRDLRSHNVNAYPCEKGPDHKKHGISHLKGYTFIVDPESTNIHEELNNYIWNDKRSGVPIDDFDHGMDAILYAARRVLRFK